MFKLGKMVTDKASGFRPAPKPVPSISDLELYFDVHDSATTGIAAKNPMAKEDESNLFHGWSRRQAKIQRLVRKYTESDNADR